MFTFSRLFSEAWTCAMTMKNIQARFECKGIYHLNRNAIVPLTKDVTNTLAQCTGLKVYCYIALHNDTGLPLHKKLYSQKKTNQDFKKDFKKVLILLLTTNYNQWKKINHLMHSLIKNMIWVSNCPTMTYLLMMPSLVCFLNIHITNQILDTHITHKTLFHIFDFLCQHLILIFKVVPSLQVLKLVCILSSVFLLNNFHTPQFFKNHPFLKDFRRRKIITLL